MLDAAKGSLKKQLTTIIVVLAVAVTATSTGAFLVGAARADGDRAIAVLVVLTVVTGVFGVGVAVILGRLLASKVQQHEEERDEYERRLRSMAAEVTLAEVEERHRIAVGVDDDLGQTLATSIVELGAMFDKPTADIVQALQETRMALSSALVKTRSAMFALSPPVLHELGLEPAVEWLLEETRERHGLEYALDRPEVATTLPNELAILLFQSVRDVVRNVVEHASATGIRASIRAQDGRLRITIEDDGVGFDADAHADSMVSCKGHGLPRIRNRLAGLGGDAVIRSSVGGGTSVTLIAPIAVRALRRPPAPAPDDQPAEHA